MHIRQQRLEQTIISRYHDNVISDKELDELLTELYEAAGFSPQDYRIWIEDIKKAKHSSLTG